MNPIMRPPAASFQAIDMTRQRLASPIRHAARTHGAVQLTHMPRGGRCDALPIWLEDQLCGASGWSAEVDADVEVEVLG
jgi:hypothetical protein